MKRQTITAKLPKSIKRITILKSHTGQGQGPNQTTTEEVVVTRKRKRKKQSKGIIRVWERLVRRGFKANAKAMDDYSDRHERSNRKRRDGWLRDYAYNIIRAGRKGGRALKITRLFG